MPDIREFPELEELESWIGDNFESVFLSMLQSINETDNPESFADTLGLDPEGIDLMRQIDNESVITPESIKEAIILGELGRGTQRQTDEPLRVAYVFSAEEAKTEMVGEDFAIGLFNAIIDGMNSSQIRQNSSFNEPTDLMKEEFDGVEFNGIIEGFFEESINLLVQVRQEDPNRAYSITNDEDIIVTEDGITREDAGVIEEEVPSSILEYPNKQELLVSYINAFDQALDTVAEQNDSSSDKIRNIELTHINFIGEWGNGTAEFGVDPFDVFIFLDPQTTIVRFTRIARSIGDEMEEVFEPPELAQEWTSDFLIDATQDDSFDPVIEAEIEDPDTGQSYDLLTDTIYTLEESDRAGVFDLIAEEREEVEEPEEVEEEEAIEIEEEPEATAEEVEPVFLPQEQLLTPEEFRELREPELTREERIAESFPELPPPLFPFFDIDDGELEIPSGVKETRTVGPRQLYDFEIEMSEKVGFEGEEPATTQEVYDDTMPEVGQKEAGATEEPAASFPKPGVYVRNRLLNQGTAFILEMYRDLLIYSGFISTKFDKRYVPGTLKTFRQQIYRMEEIPERGGPELIRRLPQNEASLRGLKTVPELPDGTRAPWLERRQYFIIVEENKDSQIWRNTHQFIYGETS